MTTSHHTHLTPDLPPLVDVPDLPGASCGDRRGPGDDEDGEGGNGSGAHQEGDGRHKRAKEGSGG